MVSIPSFIKNMYFLLQTEVEGQTEFTLVRALARHRVLDISMGPDHSAVLVAPGHVYTFGKNTEGQLGNGNTKLQSAPIAVKIFQDKPAFVSFHIYYHRQIQEF